MLVRTKGIDAYCRAHAVELAAEVGVFDYFCLVLARKLLQAVLQEALLSDSMQRPRTDGELCARSLTCAHPGPLAGSAHIITDSRRKRRAGGQGAKGAARGATLKSLLCSTIFSRCCAAILSPTSCARSCKGVCGQRKHA